MKEVVEQPGKRSDVGYKRPPVEHRFKPGQKPPPRKKTKVEETSSRDMLWQILQEDRRVIVDGKFKWMTNAEIIMNQAFLLAEKGSPVMQRLIAELLIGSAARAEDDGPMPVVINPEGLTWDEVAQRIMDGE